VNVKKVKVCCSKTINENVLLFFCFQIVLNNGLADKAIDNFDLSHRSVANDCSMFRKRLGQNTANGVNNIVVYSLKLVSKYLLKQLAFMGEIPMQHRLRK
jgi:hypothetical protein